MTYLLLNAVFLTVPIALLAGALIKAWRRRGASRLFVAAVGIALAAVLLLTAVFDNVLVGLGIVGYDETRISGIRIGVAPIEDFAYAIAAVLGLPSLWILLRRERA